MSQNPHQNQHPKYFSYRNTILFNTLIKTYLSHQGLVVWLPPIHLTTLLLRVSSEGLYHPLDLDHFGSPSLSLFAPKMVYRLHHLNSLSILCKILLKKNRNLFCRVTFKTIQNISIPHIRHLVLID